MDNLFVKSIVEAISQQLDVTLKKISQSKRIGIYGMDQYSFMIQSLLRNRKKTADMYISLSQQDVVEGKRRLSGFASRYLKDNDSLVDICHIDEVNFDEVILFSASKLNYEECNQLNDKGFISGINFFKLYDWNKDFFSEFVKGKRKISLLEMQKLEKEILKDFDEYCMEHQLRYWVCGGTLLGTMRHKGFIPWDDDIDVFMPWEDYRKFVLEYPDNEQYRVASLDKEECLGKYKTIWGKMVENTTIIREDGIILQEIHPAWVDIFPIIGMPSDEKERKLLLREVVEVERKFTEKFYRSNGNIRKRNEAYDDIIEISERYNFDDSEYVGIIGTQYREKDIMHRKVFDETVRMPFEDIEVNVPIGYKEYLDNIYGPDWMEIPSEDKRKAHNLEAYWL